MPTNTYYSFGLFVPQSFTRISNVVHVKLWMSLTFRLLISFVNSAKSSSSLTAFVCISLLLFMRLFVCNLVFRIHQFFPVFHIPRVPEWNCVGVSLIHQFFLLFHIRIVPEWNCFGLFLIHHLFPLSSQFSSTLQRCLACT